MEKFNVTGMSCAACSSRVEKVVRAVNGVTECNVNLLTNSMTVSGNYNVDDIIKAVSDAGYGASLAGQNKTAKKEELVVSETSKLVKRLIISIAFLIPLMYLSMGYTMWNFPLPSFLANNVVAIGILQALLAGIIMVINQKFFISGFKSLFKGAPNMDTLVSLGSLASYLYSFVALIIMSDLAVRGDLDGAHGYLHEFYFESAGMILALITLGKMLESYSKGKTTNALKGLVNLAPKTATVIRNSKEVSIPIDQVIKGDIFVVRPGESIPCDGVILEGSSAIDQSALTGESVPVDVTVGQNVWSGTINQSGFIKCQATKVGEDTTLSQIIKMVTDASSTKAPIAKIADKVSGVFVPAVIGISLVTFIVWIIVCHNFGYSLARAISVLVISCPCALGLATPVAIMVGNGMGAKYGILFKNAVALENTSKAKIVVLDKTGTITSGKPQVTDIITRSNFSENEFLQLAYTLEDNSEHPLAKAIVNYAQSKNIDKLTISDFLALSGSGVEGNILGKKIVGGSLKFISSQINLSSDDVNLANELSSEGKTPLLFVYDNTLLGIIGVADTIKEDSPKAIEALKNMGLHVVMLTGDNEITAKAIGLKSGVDEVVAGVLPDGKKAVVDKLKTFGSVIMVGDGINDAPALTSADIGIAIGAGSDIAIDSADVVLMKNSLMDLVGAINLSHATLRTIHQNLFWAFIYNIIGIPLAAGVFISLLGWQLNPMFGAAAMSLSSFCVVTNALRLNLCKPYKENKRKNKKKIDGLLLTQNSQTTNSQTCDNETNCQVESKNCQSNCCINNENNNYTICEENNVKSNKVEENLQTNEQANTAQEKINEDYKEANMTKTLKISGMMCGHCEMHTKKALEALDGVLNAVVSYQTGTAVVTLDKDVSNDALTNAVAEQGYTVTQID